MLFLVIFITFYCFIPVGFDFTYLYLFKVILNDRSLYNVAVLLLLMLNFRIPSWWDRNDSHWAEVQFISNLNCIQAHTAKDTAAPLTNQANKQTNGPSQLLTA
jgi:hypothetical protein